jgi:hypothetical protein
LSKSKGNLNYCCSDWTNINDLLINVKSTRHIIEWYAISNYFFRLPGKFRNIIYGPEKCLFIILFMLPTIELSNFLYIFRNLLWPHDYILHNIFTCTSTWWVDSIYLREYVTFTAKLLHIVDTSIIFLAIDIDNLISIQQALAHRKFQLRTRTRKRVFY